MFYRGNKELIDHVLISHALLPALSAVDTDVSDTTSIGTDTRVRANAPASDHAPVIAKFNL